MNANPLPQPSLQFSRISLELAHLNVRAIGVACVRAITTKRTKSDKPFLDVTVGHREGSTTLRVWSDAMPAWVGIEPGTAVELTLLSKAGFRPGTFEWNVESVHPLALDHPVLADQLPMCPVPAETLNGRWDAVVGRLTHAGKTLLSVVLDHVGEDAFLRMAAAERMHHACVGGLRWHSIEVAEGALALAAVFEGDGPPACQDGIVLGGLLHDIGKLREMQVDTVGIRRSVEGRSRYHTTLGSEIIAVACALAPDRLEAAGVSHTLIAHLQHVCESHHLQKDWGSPTAPQSREAMFIHLADQASAKWRQMTDDAANASADAGGWCGAADGRRSPVWIPSRALCLPPVTTSDTPIETEVDHDVDTASRGVAAAVPAASEQRDDAAVRSVCVVVLRDHVPFHQQEE